MEGSPKEDVPTVCITLAGKFTGLCKYTDLFNCSCVEGHGSNFPIYVYRRLGCSHFKQYWSSHLQAIASLHVELQPNAYVAFLRTYGIHWNKWSHSLTDMFSHLYIFAGRKSWHICNKQRQLRYVASATLFNNAWRLSASSSKKAPLSP